MPAAVTPGTARVRLTSSSMKGARSATWKRAESLSISRIASA
jgi:hypothetical protein